MALSGCLLSTPQQDSVETCTTTDPQRPSLGGISGNAYSVFGGDFVINKHGKSLDRERYSNSDVNSVISSLIVNHFFRLFKRVTSKVCLLSTYCLVFII